MSLYLILVRFLQNSDNNFGRITGYLTLKENRFQWQKVLNHWRFYQHKQLKQNGKIKVFHLILCHLKTPQLSIHAQDGHFLSILNYKAQIGLEELKEIIFLQLTSIKNIGWDNWLRIFHKVELFYWKVFKNKLKQL